MPTRPIAATSCDALAWAVAVHQRDVPGELELAEALCRCLRELGVPAQVVCDGEPAGLEASTLLLHPNASNYPAFGRMLRQPRSRRPFVVVWQMDPLLPTETPTEAERLGLHAARWRQRLGLTQSSGSLPRWRRRATLLRLRGRIYRYLSAPGYQRSCRLIRQTLGEAVPLDWKLVRGAAESWQTMRDALSEGWVDRVVVSTRQRQQFLAARGFEAPFVPVGGCPEWGRPLGLKRDIDVLFLGRARQGDRASKLDAIERALAPQGIGFRRVTRDCYGDSRTELLNRTRLLLNLQQYPWNPAWIRFVMAGLCGAVVVSEPTQDGEPFRAGEHYVSAPVSELPRVVVDLLRNPAQRESLATAATQLCTNSLTLRRSVESLVALRGNPPV